ncbi:MAG TPA: DUF2203 domain-containing protein [Vicinamibacterales bacterium]|nr:DUF2203 domain-containing protein [Vicinamibacterales bacterium]
MSVPRSARRFTLEEANALLPTVRQITDRAVREAASLAEHMASVMPGSDEHRRLEEELHAIVTGWAAEVEALGAEAKGLWLVDFDTGDGCYCWKHPEPSVTHYHGYTDGFAGRMKIV